MRSPFAGMSRPELLLLLAVGAVLGLLLLDQLRQRRLQARIEPVLVALQQAADGMHEQWRQQGSYAAGPCPADTREFAMQCRQPPPDQLRFRIEARGMGEMSAFVYRIDHTGRRESVTPWQGLQACWVLSRQGGCRP